MRKKLKTIFLALVAMLVPMVAWAQESTPEAKWGASNDALTESGTLSAAINAAADGSVKYIQLQRDVTTEDGNYIYAGEFALDLNGNTLSSNGYTLSIRNTGTKVTITDNSEEKSGKVVSTGNNAVLIKYGANVTISAGSYTGASTTPTLDIEESSSATISGGTFTSSSANTISNSGTLTISGGDFAPGTECVLWLFNNYQTTITGGNFNDEGQNGHIVYRSGKLYLSGYPTTSITDISVYNWESSIVVSESDIALPEGYCFYDSENQPVGTLIAGYKYTIGKDEYISEAKWGASKDALTESGTLADAINAAADGSVKYIQLHGNVTTDQGYTITAGEFTLDLNGKTLSNNGNGSSLNIKKSGTKVTITDNSEGKSGKVVSTSSIPVSINDGANVTISAGRYEGSSCAVYNLSSSATISGGTFTSSSSYTINNYGTIEISGGTFSSSSSTISNSGTLTISGGNFSSSSTYTIDNYGTLTISGGNFTSGTMCAVYIHENTQTTISGGTFTTIESALGTLYYCGGKLDLSKYPTTETGGITAITEISVYNLVENLALSASTIALPNGYIFYNGDNQAVGTLQYDKKYTIGTEPETKYTITFDENGGSGSMADTYSYDGNYLLPECTFTAPEDKFFVAWQVGESEYQPGESITITADVAIKAVWAGPEAKWGASQSELTQSGTLSAAISAAGEDGSTVVYIQLQRDVTIDGGNNINRGEFTLDLNGYTLSSNGYTLDILNTGTQVTITDSSEEKSGKVVSTGEGFSAVKASSGANVTIEAGSYESVYSTVYIEDDSSSATISGGSFTCSGFRTIDNLGTLTISGGNFTSGTQCVVWSYDESQTTITGGTFTTTEGAWGTIVYYGGKLDLSAYPTTETEGTTAITDLSVYNRVKNLAVSGSTIALPNGYSFYDGENKPVSTLKNGFKYTIGYNYELTVSSAGYATLCLPYDAVVPEGLTAYIATDAGEYIQLTKIESGKIAANEGVVIKGNTGTYYFAETTEEVTATEGNQLVGVTNETALTASDNAYMLTSDKNHENVAFRLLATDYTLAPYKAYLKVEENSARTLIPAMWDDNATGIETVNGSAQDSVIYNLAGQKLTRAQKGINIVGGKLVIK